MRVPKISIVTATLNQAEYLEHCIKSVVDQKYPNLEYIVIDGGSTDGTVDVIKRHEDRIHYWLSEPDKGHADALNKGFKRTSGDIMCWINSDDLLTPWSLNAVATIFSEFPHVSWIQGFASWWNRDGIMIGASRNLKNVYDYLTGNYAWIQQESVFWRRSLWEKTGGFINQEYRLMVDGELWTRFFQKEPLYTVDAILAGYRHTGENRAVLNMEKCHQEMHRAISDMRARLPREVITKGRKLSLARRVTYTHPVRYIGLERLFVKAMKSTFLKRACREAGYPFIRYNYQSLKWEEDLIPFDW